LRAHIPEEGNLKPSSPTPANKASTSASDANGNCQMTVTVDRRIEGHAIQCRNIYVVCGHPVGSLVRLDVAPYARLRRIKKKIVGFCIVESTEMTF
jgi:hypothetical protein